VRQLRLYFTFSHTTVELSYGKSHTFTIYRQYLSRFNILSALHTPMCADLMIHLMSNLLQQATTSSWVHPSIPTTTSTPTATSWQSKARGASNTSALETLPAPVPALQHLLATQSWSIHQGIQCPQLDNFRRILTNSGCSSTANQAMRWGHRLFFLSDGYELK